jgi:hypothetical protein
LAGRLIGPYRKKLHRKRSNMRKGSEIRNREAATCQQKNNPSGVSYIE